MDIQLGCCDCVTRLLAVIKLWTRKYLCSLGIHDVIAVQFLGTMHDVIAVQFLGTMAVSPLADVSIVARALVARVLEVVGSTTRLSVVLLFYLQ